MGKVFLDMELKERIKKLNIIKNYLKYYLDVIPYDSKNKALSLIEDINTELYWFKLQKIKKEEKDKQLSIF